MLNKAALREESEGAYRGLPIHAAAGLHQDCLGLIKGLALPYGASVLDLGAGAGAFSRRLMDAGFAVTAVEFKAQQFKAGAECHCYDLNHDFRDRFKSRFDFVVAIEIIEHLANPRHFIGNCLGCLKKGGYLLITSPNTESWLSRIIFLRRGRFLWFDEADYEGYGHITPIFTWQVQQICAELGADLISVDRSSGSLKGRLGSGWLAALRNKMSYMGILYPLMTGRKDGEINVYLIRK